MIYFIVKRNKVRNVDLLERIIGYVTANVGATFSATSIVKYFKSEGRAVSTETVLNCLKYCLDAFLFYRVKHQELQGKAGEKEVDIISAKKDQRLYVQVSYLLASEEILQRKFGVYDSIRDNFPKYAVTMDELDFSRNGIKHRNVKDFLIMKEWY